jgi:hypothetical protein
MLVSLSTFAMSAVLAASTPKAAAGPSAWHVKVSTDPITDKTKASAARLGQGGGIAIKCDAAGLNSVYILFVPDKYLGSPSALEKDKYSRGLTFRFDADQPISGSWDTNEDAVIMNDTKVVSVFVSRALTAKRLVFRTRAFDTSDATATIDLSGAAEPLKKVVAACRNAG